MAVNEPANYSLPCSPVDNEYYFTVAGEERSVHYITWVLVGDQYILSDKKTFDQVVS